MAVQKPQFRTDTIYFKIAFSILPVIIAKRPYPIPSRTRKSSSFASMVLHGRLCGRVDRHRLFFVFVLGWRTYCVSCATHVVGTYVSTSPRTFELASLYLHPAKHKKVFLLRIDTQKYAPFCASSALASPFRRRERTLGRPPCLQASRLIIRIKLAK